MYVYIEYIAGVVFNLSAQGDGRYLITNCKDQSIKLWDIRKFSKKEGIHATLSEVQRQMWDYRWQNVPRKGVPLLSSCRNTQTNKQTNTHIHTHSDAYMYVLYSRTRTHMHTNPHTHAHICTCTLMHAHAHTLAHTHTHTARRDALVKLPGDSSVMTYTGHMVKHTLLRARFSPPSTTGQVYTLHCVCLHVTLESHVQAGHPVSYCLFVRFIGLGFLGVLSFCLLVCYIHSYFKCSV